MAHNTFFQITGESGIIAGMMYILTVGSVIVLLWRRGRTWYKEILSYENRFIYLLNEAVLAGFFGLIVCSIFLTLPGFEIFYYLLILFNGINVCLVRREKQLSESRN